MTVSGNTVTNSDMGIYHFTTDTGSTAITNNIVTGNSGQVVTTELNVVSGVYVMPAFVRSNGIRPSPGDAALLIRLRHGAAARHQGGGRRR